MNKAGSLGRTLLRPIIAASISAECHLMSPIKVQFIMKMKCLFGKHKWNGCVCANCDKTRHEWNGCKCSLCGTRRDEGHDWNGCRCTVCGRVRNEGHDWNGCKCTVCGRTRNEGHDWNGCKCVVCGKIRDEGHDLDQHCTCRICGKTYHKWILQDTKTYSQEVELARLRHYHGMENMGQYVNAEFMEYHYQCENCGETRTETECDQDIDPKFM